MFRTGKVLSPEGSPTIFVFSFFSCVRSISLSDKLLVVCCCFFLSAVLSFGILGSFEFFLVLVLRFWDHLIFRITEEVISHWRTQKERPLNIT